MIESDEHLKILEERWQHYLERIKSLENFYISSKAAESAENDDQKLRVLWAYLFYLS